MLRVICSVIVLQKAILINEARLLVKRLDMASSLPDDFHDGTDIDPLRLIYYRKLYAVRLHAIDRLIRRYAELEEEM